MLDPKVVEKLKEKYSNHHPLLFQRSVERAKTNGDLFDILDTVPQRYPVRWCERECRWIEVDDVYLLDDFEQLQ